MPNSDRDDAVAWAVRASDPDFSDWNALSTWLAGDPERGRDYQQALVAVADMTDAMARFLPSADVVSLQEARDSDAARASTWRRWLPAVALPLAAGVAAIFLFARPVDGPVSQVVEAPAETALRIALTDGSVIELAGGSRLVLDPAQPRSATVERGRAMFTIRDDGSAPFLVRAGEHRIVDIGTAFEVVHNSGSTDVAVSEGTVIVDPGPAELRLTQGEGAELRDGSPTRRRNVTPDAVAQWRLNRMSYRDAPLAQVASDLSAALGRPVKVGAELDGRRFTGTLAVAAIRDDPAQLADLLDVRVLDKMDGWELSAR